MLINITNYILEVVNHCIGYTFGFFVMRFIFDCNIKNPFDVFLEFVSIN